MGDDSKASPRGIDTSLIDDDLLWESDGSVRYTFDFHELVDQLILGYTDIDVHGILMNIDVSELDTEDIHGLLAHIGALAGEEGQRVALLHILMERGDLSVDLLDELITNHHEIGEVHISDPPRSRETDS